MRRNGGGAFLVQLFGYKKTYKIENQLLVGFAERKGGDLNDALWLYHSALSPTRLRCQTQFGARIAEEVTPI